jgi:hypothetical protein
MVVIFSSGTGFACCDGFMQRWRALWLNQNDTGLGMVSFNRYRNARNQTPTATGHNHHIRIGQVFQDLRADGSLPGYDVGIIKWRDEEDSPLPSLSP